MKNATDNTTKYYFSNRSVFTDNVVDNNNFMVLATKQPLKVKKSQKVG